MSKSIDMVQCIRLLVDHVPELEPSLQSHLRDNNEILPHLFMGDISRFVTECVNGQGRQIDDCARRLIVALQQCLETGDQQVREMVSVSFVENLADQPQVYEQLKGIMGPQLKELFQTYARWFGQQEPH